ncbi:MAG: efflux RND transporter permease subunit [Methylacidiphilales bacterium]|nr:efflux RND transporter permease subunit [Candidatus Methylacidiphilales bacterium]
MWIVRLALRKPYTFTVMAILILVLGGVSYLSMPKDIFPNIDIPVVSVIWSYTGLPPQEMERRFVTISERAMNTTVNDIEHQESQSYPGVGVIKVFFQPNVKIEQAVAQVTAISQTLLKIFPPGATPPLIIQYNASSVPILQLAVSSKTLGEAELFDQSLNFIRRPLAGVKGAAIPLPYGGKQRLVSVDLDLKKCQALDISPLEVSNAINNQNVILPSGTVKIGDREYNVLLNSSPDILDQLNNLPVKQVNGATIYMRDVAQVRDGYSPQINIVKLNGEKAALLPVLKNGSASTVDIVQGVKDKLPLVRSQLPPELSVEPLFDQSIFVKAALNGVLTEGTIAATLTALMILLFLGSWRSTLIVAISIPLAICCSLILLAALGKTINIMTLGGLALAVGILVDDATVTIENIHRHMSLGKRMVKSILDGAHQIAIPAFVSTLCICIVFVPVFFLKGVPYYLFTPLALSVMFAMMASYFLSRTVAPTMANYLLGVEVHHPESHITTPPDSFFGRIHWHFTRGFEWAQDRYIGFLKKCLGVPLIVTLSAATFVVLSLLIFTPFLGRDFFPQVDAGQFRLHIRAPSGTRIEETERGFSRVEDIVRQVIPPDELDLVLDNIGLPASGINLAFTDSATVGSFDGEMLVSLKPGHKPTADYVKTLRHKLKEAMPDYDFFTQPSDIVGQILNFGLPSPIDIQVTGPAKNDKDDYDVALKLLNRIRSVRGAVDVHIQQVVSYPTFFVKVDRTRADQLGLTERDVATDLLISLSGSLQTAPNYWLSPANGVNYTVAVQTPQYKIDSLDALKQSPISAGKLPQPQLLENLAPITRSDTPAVISHYEVNPVYDVCVNVQGRDLGGVADDVQKIVDQFHTAPDLAAAPAPQGFLSGLYGRVFKSPPPDPNSILPTGSQIMVRGQVKSMTSAYTGLGVGILFAIGLVYFLMVVNFQSWLDPFIIIMALPGALAGIVWMLFLTHTPLSVPALMGAIMSIGVATANSILVVSFANEQRHGGRSALDAALAAGRTRLRPVIMTALAMIIGMLPMSLGLGEGGEQNAPLGRAVIGGLLVATAFTLLFVPVVYSVMRRKDKTVETDPLLFEPSDYEIDEADVTGHQASGTSRVSYADETAAPGGNGHASPPRNRAHFQPKTP